MAVKNYVWRSVTVDAIGRVETVEAKTHKGNAHFALIVGVEGKTIIDAFNAYN